MKRVGIYLKSGFANLGFGTGAIPVIIKCLDQQNIPIAKIIGCSAGSFAVPVMAVREYADVLTAWLNIEPPNISHLHVWQTLRHFFSRPSLLDSSPLFKYARNFIEPHLDVACSSEAIPFEIITTDARTGDGVYFANTPENKDKLVEVCMRSAGIIPFFGIGNIGGVDLIDGGFSDDMPIKRFVDSGCNTVFVIDLYNGLPAFNENDPKERCWPAMLMRATQISIQQHSRLRLDLNARINEEIEALENGGTNITAKSKLRISDYSKCQVIFITAGYPIYHISFREFDDFTKKILVMLGYLSADKALRNLGLYPEGSPESVLRMVNEERFDLMPEDYWRSIREKNGINA